MASKTAIRTLPVVSVGWAVVKSATWVAINTSGLSEACAKLRISNLLDVDAEISFDGINSHDVALKGQQLDISIAGPGQPPGREQLIPMHTIVYVRAIGADAKSGNVYLASYYV